MAPQNIFQLTGVDQVIPVGSIEEVKAYSMGPNCRVPLFSKNEDVFYIKYTDENGFPSIRTFDYTERVEIEETPLTREEIRNDIREIIREELANAKQFISEPRTSTANSSAVNDAKSSGSKYAGNTAAAYTKPKQSGQSRTNSANVESGEK